MSVPSVTSANYPSFDELRDIYLRSIKLDMQRLGLSANVLPGSDWYIAATAIAQQVQIAIANNQISADQMSPLAATGDTLTELAGIYGITPRAASVAAGYVEVFGNGAVVIPSGYQCTAPDGQKYQTTSVNTVTLSSAGNVFIAVQGVDGGASNDQDPATVLTWDLGSIGNLSPTCTVSDDGLTGGTDADTDETLRARLVDRLSFPGTGGNWSQVKAWTEAASASVQKAFVYQAARGPGSYDVAIVGDSGDRTLSTTVQGTCAAAVLAQMPGVMSLNLTTVSPQEVDVVLKATLALPVNAGGAGGGWVDAIPFPNASSGSVKITSAPAAPTSTRIYTDATTAANGPAVGNTIGIWDEVNQAMNVYYVSASGVSGGFLYIEVQGGFSPVPTSGAYISAGCVNLENYADEFLAQSLLLGPGEKTTNTDIIPPALRQPSSDIEFPSDLSNVLLSRIMGQHEEILDLEYAARLETGTATTITTPAVPATTADPPEILVLKHFAIRKA